MKRGALFKIVRAVVVMVIALGIMQALIVFKPEAERIVPTDTGRLVEVFAAEPQSVVMTVESYGTVQPRRMLKLVAEVRGQIVGLHPDFEEGGFVDQGAVMVRIDPRDYELEVENRKAQLRQIDAELMRLDQELRNIDATIKIARNNVTLSRNELERQRQLVERNVVAQSTVEKIEQQYLNNLERLQNVKNQKSLIEPRREMQRAQRQMIRVMQKQAALNLERTRITAPFEGWVVDKMIETGQLVNAGQLVGTIYQAGALEVEAHIPIRDLKWLPLPVSKSRPLAAKVVFDAAGERHTWPGRVIRQKARIDDTTRTLPLIVEPTAADPEKDNKAAAAVQLRPGMFVTIKIAGHTVENVFVLPRHLLYDGNVVYTVADNRLRIKSVRVLRAYRDTVFLDQGLSADDLIVSTPLSAATEGMKLRINP